ncbi:S-layer homology domain-containing protein, partial [Cohnella suwonensis]
MSLLKRARKIAATVLVFCLVVSSYAVTAGAAAIDTTGHWAAAQLNEWVDKGFLKGYEDGSLKPDNQISRAEFIALVNRSFGFSEKAEISFSDVNESNWAYVEVQKAVAAGYFNGYEDGKIGASRSINRQEVAVIISRLLGLDENEDAAADFADSASLAYWSAGAVGAALEKGIMKGYEDGSFQPARAITRAEAVVTLNRAIEAGVTPTTKFDKAGTYGPKDGQETIEGNVVISAQGVTLHNTVVKGNLTIAESVGDGDATLDGVVVQGETIVAGGGANSIHFKDSVLVIIIVNKKTGEVRIVAEGSTKVQEVQVQSGAKIESNGSDSSIGKVILSDRLPEGSKVSLIGNFNEVEVNSKETEIEFPSGIIKKLLASKTARGTKLNLGKTAKIIELILKSAMKVTGQGTIEKATIDKEIKDQVQFEKQPNQVVESDGVTSLASDPVEYTVDTTAPTLSATSASGSTGTGTTLNFTSNEAGTYYYLVYAAADSAPNASIIEAQGIAVAKGTAAATAAANTVNVTGLAEVTAYKAYVIVKDAAGNVSAVSTLSFTTADETEPTLSATSASGATGMGTTLNFT